MYELNRALQTVDFRQVNIVGDTVQLLSPDAWIDLGAIAKGYIADKVAELLLGRGVDGALIDLGGDVVAVGSRPDGSPWRVGVSEPVVGSSEFIGVLEVNGVSIVSSGTYERLLVVDGVQYHHILDPFTGMPVCSDVVSATVVAESAVVGEGLSTIAVLLGSELVVEMFERSSGFIGAVLVLENGEVLEFGDVRMKR